MHEITQFVVRHWMLVSAFVVVLILLLIEEAQNPSAKGQLTPTAAIHLINHDKAIIVDLREADAFQDGHIIGAKHLSADDFDQLKDKLERHRKKQIILADVNGSKAMGIAARLKKDQFEQVHVLKGGMAAWKAAEMPTVKSKSKK